MPRLLYIFPKNFLYVSHPTKNLDRRDIQQNLRWKTHERCKFDTPKNHADPKTYLLGKLKRKQILGKTEYSRHASIIVMEYFHKRTKHCVKTNKV